MREILVTALLMLTVACAVVSGQPLVEVSPNSVGQGRITNVTAAVPLVSTSVNLVVPSRQVTIKSQSDVIYVNFANATATSTAGFRLESGSAFTRHGLPISQIKILGATATGTYSVYAE